MTVVTSGPNLKRSKRVPIQRKADRRALMSMLLMSIRHCHVMYRDHTKPFIPRYTNAVKLLLLRIAEELCWEVGMVGHQFSVLVFRLT